jgi:leucine dehydrogenase
MVTYHGVGMPAEGAHVLSDPDSSLDGVIVVHSSTLGPAAGGCRFWTYASSEEVFADAFRLAEGMSYKNALAGLPLGGGKAVLRRPVAPFDRARLFGAFGRAVANLGGAYVTAEDVGTSVEDMLSVSARTRHVAGLPPRSGRPGGDPSPWTAKGVFASMEVAVQQRLNRPLSDCTVAIQGLGHVGASLARLLATAGATLIVADVNNRNAELAAAATGATVVAAAEILACDVDVFAPCALGGVLSQSTVGLLKARVVCGAANNQLAEPEDGVRLAERGILYAPDYVVNAGGIINVAAEYLGWSVEEAARRVGETGRRLADVLASAHAEGVASNIAADRMARAMIGRRTRALNQAA